MKKIWNNVRMFLWMTFLTGIKCPLIITAIAQLTIKQKADGDFLSSKEKIAGATLIAQKFERDKYFWARSSAVDYSPPPSGRSNLGPISAALKKAVVERQEKIFKVHNVDKDKVLISMFLQPIFKLNALQNQEGLKVGILRIYNMIIKLSLGFLGESCVTVLLLNKALDELPQNLKQIKG